MSDFLPQAAASGVVTGCVYALVALSLVIVYKSTDVVNFAGGELLMLGGYIGLLALIYFELSYPLMFVAVIVAMYVVGAAFERITLSTVTGRRYSKNAEADLVPMVVATIGLGYLLKGAVRVVPYTEEVRRLPPLLAGPPVFIGDVILQQGLDFEVPVAAGPLGEDVEYLFWVGCAGSLEDRARKTTRAIATLLHTVITAAYILRFFGFMFFGQLNSRWSSLRDLRPVEIIGGAMLIIAIFLMGLWPAPFADRIADAVAHLPGVTS